MTDRIAALELGKVPRVVGTIITESFLRDWSAHPRKLPCDLVELRVDGFSDFPNWPDIGRQIESFDLPVLATIRLAAEGGKWTRPDQDRWSLIEAAIRKLSGVDVEMESDLAPLAARFCADLGKLCVLSHHDFEKTPPVPKMSQMIERSHSLGAIAKIAATVRNEQNLAELRSLLRHPWPAPICIIGMGALGRWSRLTFPREGSCFTYGYLDEAGAPGQCSAQELMSHLSHLPL